MKTERKERSRGAGQSRDVRDRQANEIGRLREQLAEHAKRIADLKCELAHRQQNSTRTSKPPSSDGLAGDHRVRGRRVKSRKAGGQPGHAGHHRELVPLVRVDVIVDLVPDTCRRCARPFHTRHEVGAPRLVVQRLLDGGLQIPISLGSTQNAREKRVAVAGPYEELEHALAQQSVLNSDETGHRTNGTKRWR